MTNDPRWPPYQPGYGPQPQQGGPWQPYQPPPQPPKKPRTGLVVGLVIGGLVLSLAMCGIIAGIVNQSQDRPPPQAQPQRPPIGYQLGPTFNDAGFQWQVIVVDPRTNFDKVADLARYLHRTNPTQHYQIVGTMKGWSRDNGGVIVGQFFDSGRKRWGADGATSDFPGADHMVWLE